MKKNLIYLAIVTANLLSCNSNDSVNNNNFILPSNITVEENGIVISSSDYTYQDNKIVSIETTSQNNFWKEVYTYNNDLIISNISYVKLNSNETYNVSNVRNFTYYNNGKVKTLIESRPGIELMDKSEYTYNQNSVCVKSSINNVGEVFPISMVSLTYTIDNLTNVDESLYNYSTNSYGPNNILTNIFYDNKNSITKNILGFNKLVFHNNIYSLENNPTNSNVIFTDENGNSENLFGFHYTYDYNNNDYPITKYVLDANNNIIQTIHITY